MQPEYTSERSSVACATGTSFLVYKSEFSLLLFPHFSPRLCESLKAKEKDPLYQHDSASRVMSEMSWKVPLWLPFHMWTALKPFIQAKTHNKIWPIWDHKVLMLCFLSGSFLTSWNSCLIVQNQKFMQAFDKFKYLHCVSMKYFSTQIWFFMYITDFSIITSELRLLFNCSKGYQKC